MGHEAHHHEPKPLKWFASPIVDTENESSTAHRGNPHYRGPSLTTSTTYASDAELGRSNSFRSKLLNPSICSSSATPAFHRHEEATTAELFYDLFFVANLTTFTSMLEINDTASLQAYIGFFSLLWLTW